MYRNTAPTAGPHRRYNTGRDHVIQRQHAFQSNIMKTKMWKLVLTRTSDPNRPTATTLFAIALCCTVGAVRCGRVVGAVFLHIGVSAPVSGDRYRNLQKLQVEVFKTYDCKNSPCLSCFKSRLSIPNTQRRLYSLSSDVHWSTKAAYVSINLDQKWRSLIENNLPYRWIYLGITTYTRPRRPPSTDCALQLGNSLLWVDDSTAASQHTASWLSQYLLLV